MNSLNLTQGLTAVRRPVTAAIPYYILYVYRVTTISDLSFTTSFPATRCGLRNTHDQSLRLETAGKGEEKTYCHH